MIIYRCSQCHYQFLKEKGYLVVIKTLKGQSEEVARIAHTAKSVILKAVANELDLQFSYGPDEASMKPMGEVQHMNVISFEMAGGFNGPYVGMYATGSVESSRNVAEFDWFEYLGR